jgi:hypothetical protein
MHILNEINSELAQQQQSANLITTISSEHKRTVAGAAVYIGFNNEPLLSHMFLRVKQWTLPPIITNRITFVRKKYGHNFKESYKAWLSTNTPRILVSLYILIMYGDWG